MKTPKQYISSCCGMRLGHSMFCTRPKSAAKTRKADCAYPRTCPNPHIEPQHTNEVKPARPAEHAYCAEHKDGTLECEKQPRREAHTPLPWAQDGYGITSRVFNICTLDTMAKDGDDNQIGIGELSANAAFIVRAVNAHEELVSFIKMLIDGSEDRIPPRGEEELVAMAKALLAKAEGK